MPFPNESTQFPKGQSGNPNGRPKKLPELDKLLADVLGEEKDGITAIEAILKRLRSVAASGTSPQSIRAAEILLDRAYGKAKGDDTVRVRFPTPAEIAAADAKANEVLAKYGLAPRTPESE